MEKLYRKIGTGKSTRYESVGFSGLPDISDGIWVVQTKPSSKSHESILWKVGNLERPVDIVTHASLQTMSQELATYLIKLADKDSIEWKEAKELLGGYLKDEIYFGNISAGDITKLFIRQIALNLEEGEIIDWGRLMFDFRKTLSYNTPEYENQVKVLYSFIDFLKDRKYTLNQRK